MFTDGKIEGVLIRDLVKYSDERGWLMEIFREDELEQQFRPVMGYISFTQPGVARGPHEHADQADNFCFLGPSNFRIYLWDNRRDSPTYNRKQVVSAGEGEAKSVVIPAGVVHAYKNIGPVPGMVVNCPNRLFAGAGKREPVDEIRHEDDPNTVYKLD
jgi:dTDP-4-dehydrorhamnose 3,5-epimerase